MDDPREHQAPWTNDERPRAAGEPGGPTTAEAVGPPDAHPETAQPAFSKGGHGANDPLPGGLGTGDRDLTDAERERRSEASPPRQ